MREEVDDFFGTGTRQDVFHNTGGCSFKTQAEEMMKNFCNLGLIPSGPTALPIFRKPHTDLTGTVSVQKFILAVMKSVILLMSCNHQLIHAISPESVLSK